MIEEEVGPDFRFGYSRKVQIMRSFSDAKLAEATITRLRETLAQIEADALFPYIDAQERLDCIAATARQELDR